LLAEFLSWGENSRSDLGFLREREGYERRNGRRFYHKAWGMEGVQGESKLGVPVKILIDNLTRKGRKLSFFIHRGGGDPTETVATRGSVSQESQTEGIGRSKDKFSIKTLKARRVGLVLHHSKDEECCH